MNKYKWIRYKRINLESKPILLEFWRWLEQSVLHICAGETLPVVGFNHLPYINGTPQLWFKTNKCWNTSVIYKAHGMLRKLVLAFPCFLSPFLMTGFVDTQTAQTAHRLKQMRRIGSAHGIFLLAGHCLWNQDAPQDVSRDICSQQTTRHDLWKPFKSKNTHHIHTFMLWKLWWVAFFCDVNLWTYTLRKTISCCFTSHEEKHTPWPLWVVTFIALGPPKAPETKV